MLSDEKVTLSEIWVTWRKLMSKGLTSARLCGMLFVS